MPRTAPIVPDVTLRGPATRRLRGKKCKWNSNEFEDQKWDPYDDVCVVKAFQRTKNAVKKVRAPARIYRRFLLDYLV